jgi:hypothetical protein
MALDTTWAALTSSWDSVFFGVGSHRLNILSQTVSQVARGEIRFSRWNTEFGSFPYGPHSVLFWSLGGYGIVGAALRCAAILTPWWTTVVAMVRNRFGGRQSIVMCAVMVSGLGFFFDDSHITHPYLMCVWYLFCFIGIDETKRRVHARASHRSESDFETEPVECLVAN